MSENNILMKINLYGAGGLPSSEKEIQKIFADCLGHIAFAIGQGFMSGDIDGVGEMQIICSWQIGSGTPFSVDAGA